MKDLQGFQLSLSNTQCFVHHLHIKVDRIMFFSYVVNVICNFAVTG